MRGICSVWPSKTCHIILPFCFGFLTDFPEEKRAELENCDRHTKDFCVLFLPKMRKTKRWRQNDLQILFVAKTARFEREAGNGRGKNFQIILFLFTDRIDQFLSIFLVSFLLRSYSIQLWPFFCILSTFFYLSLNHLQNATLLFQVHFSSTFNSSKFRAYCSMVVVNRTAPTWILNWPPFLCVYLNPRRGLEFFWYGQVEYGEK